MVQRKHQGFDKDPGERWSHLEVDVGAGLWRDAAAQTSAQTALQQAHTHRGAELTCGRVGLPCNTGRPIRASVPATLSSNEHRASRHTPASAVAEGALPSDQDLGGVLAQHAALGHDDLVGQQGRRVLPVQHVGGGRPGGRHHVHPLHPRAPGAQAVVLETAW